MRSIRILSLLVIVAVSSACTSMDRQRSKYPDPDQRLDHLLALNELARQDGSGCREIWKADHAARDCERILGEVERLHTEHPHNERIMLGVAVLNYEAGRPEQTQYYLDQLLARPGAHPEAAVLRSHIALQEGNNVLARELLQRQIMLAPDRLLLRETLAAVYYLEGKYAKARAVLNMASRLGAPQWRIAYHHGLIKEAEQQWSGACEFYATALEQKPELVPARARLIGLTEHIECRDPTHGRVK